MSVISVYMDQRGVPLRREGKWSCGPCPVCGGDDRFRVVYDEDKGREFYSCRQCGRHRDDIQFLRDFVGMSYEQARQEAERLRGLSTAAPPAVEDADVWYEGCMDFINWAHRRLMRSDRALNRLERERGILRATARKLGLGYNGKDVWVPRPSFGLSDRERPDGRPYDLCLPAGLVIPVHAKGDLYGVQVRRREVYRGERYATVPGSRLVPMLFDGSDDAAVVVVESYLCGALVWQELGGEATVLALGSVAVRPDDDLQKLLDGARVILIALDSDVAGAEQAKVWLKRYPNAVRCPVPPRLGKDPTEAHLNGLDLRAWFAAGCTLADKSDGADTAGKHTTRHADLLTIGSAAARVHVVSECETARRAVARIVRDCSAIAVAVRVEATVSHPLGGYHPKLSRLTRCAVYAPTLDRVYVFDMGSVRRADLAPLWGLTVLAHDGVRLLRCFKELREGGNRVASTMLMANGLLNGNVTLREAFAVATDAAPLPVWPEGDNGLALRVMALPQCFEGLFKQLGPENMPDTVGVLAGAQRAIACLEVDGASFDADAHRALVAVWERELVEHTKLLPEGLDPAKHKDVRRWLKRVVPAERRSAWKATSSGTLSTRDENLALADDMPEIHALREHRRLAKLLNTYGERFAAYINPATGKLHARWELGGCATGRVSCSDPNLLALPRDPAFRALFRAPEGRRLLVADVSQIQLRIAAHIAGDEAMLDAYARGLDLHNATAAALTGKTIKEVTKEERRLAKACNFGLLFGQGERGFRDYANANYGLTLTFRQAERVRTTWLRAYPGVADWHRRTKRALERGRRVYTEGGRTGGAEDFRGNALQQALAFQIQGTEAEVMMRALSRLLPALRAHGGLLALFVHDEVVLEVPEDGTAVAAVADAVGRAVADALLRYFPDASTDGLVEVRAVQSWADAK